MQWRNVTTGVASLAILAAGVSSSRAETPLERGTYLMLSIVACGNCHTPKGPQGDVPGMELAGGVVPTVVETSHVRDNIIRIGLNYRFDGPVVARY